MDRALRATWNACRATALLAGAYVLLVAFGTYAPTPAESVMVLVFCALAGAGWGIKHGPH